jgi:NAD+ kinase
MIKLGYLADKSDKSQLLLSKLHKNHKMVNVINDIDCDYIIILGGDGFMLKCLHNFMQLKKPFFGINTGNAGFLLNVDNHTNCLETRIKEAITTKIIPLQMTATFTDGSIKSAIAFNEVSIVRNSPQAAKIRIYINDFLQINELIADGILLATPAGSSAYNFSVGGSIVPIESNILSLTPIGAFRPRRWSGALLPHNSIVKFQILEHEKRPVTATTDFNQHGTVTEITIQQSNSYISLLFDKGHSLEERIINEQFLY